MTVDLIMDIETRHSAAVIEGILVEISSGPR